MLILGINDTHDSSACLIDDGKIVCAIAEERLTRIKNISSFPIRSVNYIFNNSKYKIKDIDCVAVATKNLHSENFYNIVSQFGIDEWRKFHEYYKQIIYSKKKPKFKKFFNNYKPNKILGYNLKNIAFKPKIELSKKDINKHQNERVKQISRLLNIDKNKIYFYDHHLCHASYGYFSNSKNFKLNKVIAITSDSGGDNTYESITIFDKDKFKVVKKSKDNLIGKIYESITLLLGMHPLRHPYKIMGLSPYASEHNKAGPRDIFLKSLKVKGLNFVKNSELKDHFFYFEKKLKNFRFDGISGGLQDFVEISLTKWFSNISKKFKCKNFVFSGGVANNVKANLSLISKNFVNFFYVPPGPGDESLSIGAAYLAINQRIGYKNTKKILNYKNENCYWSLGTNIKEENSFFNNKFIKNNFNIIEDKYFRKTAKLLASNNVILLFQGKMEFGQRALGHRSIIANPSNVEVVKKINETFKRRDFWMPFTPSILDTDMKKYIKVYKKKSINMQFMTTCFETTNIAKKDLVSAIHPYDETIRPQIVTKKTCSDYYKIINEFKKLTGIGALLNTSLNIHDKPIVMKPMDIFNEMLKKKNIKINYLLINKKLLIRKKIFK